MGSGVSASRASLKPGNPTAKPKKDASNKEQKLTSVKSVTEAKDVMISYSHADKDFMERIKASLEENGITVWVDVTGLKAGVDFLSKIGQAIIDAKMFLSLLSLSSIKSKYCQDELALAYISNKDIFPIGIDSPDELFPQMDTGMKLQLARFNWNLFTNAEDYETNVMKLVEKMKAVMNKDTSAEKEGDDNDNGGKKTRTNVNKKFTKQKSFYRKMSLISDVQEKDQETDFWMEHFQGRSSVLWDDFEKAFNKKYNALLNKVFSKSDQVWLRNIIRRELNVEETEAVCHDDYLEFCTVDGEKEPFWNRVQDQALESYTMKEVFNMESSVRVEAIENLGKFRSTAVIEALLDLLSDKDKNVQAVAAISLARTGECNQKIIHALMKCLNEKDRLVRESACLALGHLQVEEAVPKLVHLWRNDFISHVREAAQVALGQIGGPEADKAMHMTKVLSEEIRALTKE